jgi:hypothetical protein
LRRIDAKVDRRIDDRRDLKTRVTCVEQGLAGVDGRLDRLEARMDRVERKLELTSAHSVRAISKSKKVFASFLQKRRLFLFHLREYP